MVANYPAFSGLIKQLLQLILRHFTFRSLVIVIRHFCHWATISRDINMAVLLYMKPFGLKIGY